MRASACRSSLEATVNAMPRYASTKRTTCQQQRGRPFGAGSTQVRQARQPQDAGQKPLEDRDTGEAYRNVLGQHRPEKRIGLLKQKPSVVNCSVRLFARRIIGATAFMRTARDQLRSNELAGQRQPPRIPFALRLRRPCGIATTASSFGGGTAVFTAPRRSRPSLPRRRRCRKPADPALRRAAWRPSLRP